MIRQLKNFLFGKLSGVATEFYNGTGEFSTLGLGGAALSYYFDDAASDIATYGILSPEPVGGVEDIDSQAVAVGDGEVLIEAFAVADAFGVNLIPGGHWDFKFWRYVDNAAGASEIVIRVYKRATDTTETELFNTTTGDIADTTVALQSIVSTQLAFAVDPTDRLVLKLFAKTDSVVNRTISFVHNGTTHYSSFVTPFFNDIQDFVGDSGAGGQHGLVPAPAAGDTAAGKFLKADATWSVPGAGGQIYKVGVTIDGGGSAITTGVKGYTSIPTTGTITKVRLLADQSGNAVMDIWLDVFANYPPTVADTITAAAKPTLSAAQSYEDTTLTGWTTAVTAGDVLGFNVDSAATITRLTLELEITP